MLQAITDRKVEAANTGPQAGCNFTGNYPPFSQWYRCTICKHNIWFYLIWFIPLIARFMGPTWVLSAPDGPHVGPMNLAIWVMIRWYTCGIYCSDIGREVIYNKTSLITMKSQGNIIDWLWQQPGWSFPGDPSRLYLYIIQLPPCILPELIGDLP